MSTEWEPEFEEILRGFLPFLAEDESLDPDLDLRDMGLDSLGTVELLGKLEAQYQVHFVDDALNRDTFATPDALWTTVARLADPVA
ncbi:phosphopantetheine-binding protein [Streptomyces sp. NPDC001250]|uniref:phosphopantetheine-binding protein n=1 Tax=unclassified Streptomyces TaxID=2593676 RepID=UPI0033258ABE